MLEILISVAWSQVKLLRIDTRRKRLTHLVEAKILAGKTRDGVFPELARFASGCSLAWEVLLTLAMVTNSLVACNLHIIF